MNILMLESSYERNFAKIQEPRKISLNDSQPMILGRIK